ncbi:Coumaroyl-CoA\\x3aanthocyanidin 3-O-glucoside-6-O-coumaroyltransferase 1 [Striga hermonthica]|uniref:Coumaroyl-CoA\x3aanthocyanidin 3-O-glucoside-6-O-coumaroyltransferase 1 n=1 Tax=Striga hermonthica TaxID=68872 RepID=A0A9N7N7S6_STRHE|nr:Coumaroyl-CoA\\x3aanthocyanidin 3-O-glucoside-6-O-coumaroyltransferase 1 [Striga hermonthica]
MITLIESSRVAPPPDSVPDRTLPLAFLDITWLHFPPLRRLLFYKLPFSESHDSDNNLVSRLKHSLSLTLEHYFLLAGNLVYPLDTEKNMPIFRYASTDSVPVSVFCSSSAHDFDTLVGNQPREADIFYDYAPRLSPTASSSDGTLLQGLLAVQVTLFPGRGICIGVANHHVIGDGTSIVGFIRAWASTCKLGVVQSSRPIFERDLIKGPPGLDSIYWDNMKRVPFGSSSTNPLPTNRVRATFVLDRARINKLKDLVVAKFPSFSHLSSFVVTSAYVWTCLAKSLSTNEEFENRVNDDEMEFFLFPADIRARLSPPLPESYFGNCLSGGVPKIRHHELIGPDGYLLAARAIADEIKNKLNGMDKITEWFENAPKTIRSILGKRLLSVSGSARVDLYGADFGLGRARKVETLSIDGEKYSMSLCKPRDCEGGLENRGKRKLVETKKKKKKKETEMAESPAPATVLDIFEVHPSPEIAPATEMTLPLVHFDIIWLHFHRVQRLLFFDFPCSKTRFLQSLVPDLRRSLAHTLGRFLPLAGKIVHPLDDAGRPSIRFSPGDSVPLTVSECSSDFDHLTGDHPRLSDEFYPFVPVLPSATRSENEVVIPALALQVTLFPGRGLCLGITNHHAAGDASSIVRFIKSWAATNSASAAELTPYYDRSAVADPEGLDRIYWDLIRTSRAVESPPLTFPLHKLRRTFILTGDDVRRLKAAVLAQLPTARHVSTFSVACALAWSCLVRADPPPPAAADEEPEYMGFPADCRSRLNPPLPAAYFGNCLAFVKAESSHGLLRAGGVEGLAHAAEAIGSAVQRTVYNEKGILDGAEGWPAGYGKLIGKRLFGVAGSPRFDLYEVDFGWGRPRKFESPSIDADTSMSMCKSRDFEGGLEIGLSRPEKVLEAFAANFEEQLRNL